MNDEIESSSAETERPEAESAEAERAEALRSEAPRSDGAADRDDELLSRLELIESQPLDQRAAGFDQLIDELQSELQSSDREDPAAS